jgi:hypothetical protein
MIDQPKPGRRYLLAMMTALPALMRGGRSVAAPAFAAAAAPQVAAVPFPEGAKLLVAGPADGTLNRWADAILPALEQSLPPDTAIHRIEIGAADGVTGANQFETRSAPDGLTVLLVPGQAMIAWMVGDPRTQFDVGHWMPVMAGIGSGIVVGRASALAPDGRARTAAAGPNSLDLAALLGLQLLGTRLEPVFGPVEPAAARNAFAQGTVDAVFLRGPRVLDQFAELASVGAQPLFTLGSIDETGQTVRDPLFLHVPHFAELYGAQSGGKPAGRLYDAWCAAAAAAKVEFALVLPQLTPAAMVALWRRAGADATAAAAVQATGASQNVRPLGGPAATTSTAATAADAATLLELRRWLATRLNWHPSQ